MKPAAIRVNERNLRIGESHPRAKLTDAEVDQLVADRGPEVAPLMSYGELAAKWGISKASVRDMIKGRRRGQVGPRVDREPTRKVRGQVVVVKLRVGLHQRAKLHRLGGSAWLRKVLDMHTVNAG